jgi:hypothetical protein
VQLIFCIHSFLIPFRSFCKSEDYRHRGGMCRANKSSLLLVLSGVCAFSRLRSVLVLSIVRMDKKESLGLAKQLMRTSASHPLAPLTRICIFTVQCKSSICIEKLDQSGPDRDLTYLNFWQLWD